MNRGKVFVSYRRETGAEMARLIRDALQRRGYRVFMDVEDLRSGPFNTALFAEIESATDVVVVLTPGCLDRCSNPNDWVRLEVAHAIKHGRNVVPVMTRGFSWPRSLSEDLAALPNFQGVPPSHEYFEASMDKLVSLLEGRPEPGRLRISPCVVAVAFLGISGSLAWWLYQAPLRQRREASPSVVTSGIREGDAIDPLSADVRALLQMAYLTPLAETSPRAVVGVWMRRPSESRWGELGNGKALSNADRYRILFRSIDKSWFYIFQVDATGRVDWLFPLNKAIYSTGTNPVTPGMWIQVPDGDRALQLDANLGVEHLYTVVTSERWLELENALEQAGSIGAGYAPVRTPLGLKTRGVAGLVTDESPVLPPEFGNRRDPRQFLLGKDGVLVQETWFQHVSKPGEVK